MGQNPVRNYTQEVQIQSTNQWEEQDTNNMDYNQREFSCSICGCEFSSLTEVEIHLKANHSETAVVSSVYDEYGIPQQRLDPTKRNEFLRCEFCTYTCILKGDMVKHRRTHTGDRPFRCRFCSYSAKQKSSVIVHERRHTGDTPYKCNYCSYKSTQKVSLDRHKKRHMHD